MTPIQFALRAGSDRCFHYLYHECKALLTQHSKSHENSLHFAVLGGDMNALKVLKDNFVTYAGTWNIYIRDPRSKCPIKSYIAYYNIAAIFLGVTPWLFHRRRRGRRKNANFLRSRCRQPSSDRNVSERVRSWHRCARLVDFTVQWSVHGKVLSFAEISWTRTYPRGTSRQSYFRSSATRLLWLLRLFVAKQTKIGIADRSKSIGPSYIYHVEKQIQQVPWSAVRPRTYISHTADKSNDKLIIFHDARELQWKSKMISKLCKNLRELTNSKFSILMRTLASPICAKTVLDRVVLTKVPGQVIESDEISVIVDGQRTTLKCHVVLPENCTHEAPFVSKGQVFMGSQWQVMMYYLYDHSVSLYIGCTAVTPVTAEAFIKAYNPADRSISVSRCKAANENQFSLCDCNWHFDRHDVDIQRWQLAGLHQVFASVAESH